VDASSENLPTPTLIVSGFLGSGKTTLINRLLQHPAAGDTAVIVNEFGEIGIDNDLIEQVDGTTLLLDSGCICCTLRDDLATTMLDLHERRTRGDLPPFSRLVIETSGLADPTPVVRTLVGEPIVASFYGLGSVVATVDALNGASSLAGHVEAAQQVAVADRVVLTKTDIAPAEAATNAVRALNPRAPLLIGAETGLEEHVRTAGNGDWLANLPPAEDGHEHHSHAPSAIQTFTVFRSDPLPWGTLARWLRQLGTVRGDRLLRMKGLVNVAGRSGPVVIHGVQQLIHVPKTLPAWPCDDRRTRIVFITHDLSRSTIERLLD
jgi:G3E family GTPase